MKHKNFMKPVSCLIWPVYSLIWLHLSSRSRQFVGILILQSYRTGSKYTWDSNEQPLSVYLTLQIWILASFGFWNLFICDILSMRGKIKCTYKKQSLILAYLGPFLISKMTGFEFEWWFSSFDERLEWMLANKWKMLTFSWLWYVSGYLIL